MPTSARLDERPTRPTAPFPRRAATAARATCPTAPPDELPRHGEGKRAPMEFVLEPAAYELLLARKDTLPPALLEALRLAVPEGSGYRFTTSPELALELAWWFVEEASQRGPATIDDLSLRAVVAIGIELGMWPPGPWPPRSC